MGDHLGSTALTVDGASGAKLSELRYKPWGELRYVWGPTMTGLRYTGQRLEGTGLYDYGGGTRWYDPSLGRWTSPGSVVPLAALVLDYYGARWYDSSLERWAQADTIVPLASQEALAWDRYAYSYGNPVMYIDPSGHVPLEFDTGDGMEGYDLDRIFDSGTGDKPPQPDAPPDFENPLPGGNPPPPHVEGLPDDKWEWGEWPGLGEG